MGDVSGNTGYVKFNSYVDLLDDTDPYNTNWAGLLQLATADAPLASAGYLSLIGYWGYSGAPASYNSVGSRVECKELNVNVPIGSILSGIEVKVRGGGTWVGGGIYSYFYDSDFHINGTKVGSNLISDVQMADTSVLNAPLSTHTLGSPTDNRGLNIGSGKINDVNNGIQARVRFTDSGGGGSTYGPRLDYLFGNYYWKQTGVLLAM